MSNVFYLLTVAERSRLPDFMQIFRETGVEVCFVTLGHGTMDTASLRYPPLSSAEKAVCMSFVTEASWRTIKHELETKVKIDIPGVGMALIIPASSVGGKRELAFLLSGQKFTRGEESVLKNTDRELIIAICNQGYGETVMDAARSAGAGGGTIIHAKGTGMESAEKFFGVTLASDKTLVLIATKTSNKDGIMQAIMKMAGPDTPAHAISFSLPVTQTAGLRLTDDLAPEDEPSAEG